MPVHDWSQATPGEFHDFHVSWLSEIRKALNAGLLPGEYYASVEQHVGGFIPDVTTLRTAAPINRRAGPTGVLLTEPRRPPTVVARSARRERAVTVRQAGAAELVAVIEVISASNDSFRDGLNATIRKATAFLNQRVHVVILDVIPPGRLDAGGLHAAIWAELVGQQPVAATKPLTTASYRAGDVVQAYVHELAPGDVPLFLRDGCIEMPMERLYAEAFAALGFPLQDRLDPQA